MCGGTGTQRELQEHEQQQQKWKRIEVLPRKQNVSGAKAPSPIGTAASSWTSSDPGAIEACSILESAVRRMLCRLSFIMLPND